MVAPNPSPPPDEQVRSLSRTVARLQDAVRELETERQRLIRQRWRQLLLLGLALSLLVHIGIMIFLGTMYRDRHGGPAPQSVNLEFAVLAEEELTQLDSTELDELVTEAIDDFEQIVDPATELTAESPAAEMEVSAAGSTPTLGSRASGSGGDSGLGGGAAGTSFFGISSRGTRFAYIVDRSGSMGEGRKMPTAMRELADSIRRLPDYAQFYVVLFSGGHMLPPMQDGWQRARKAIVRSLIRWLGEVSPGGGTRPASAFQQVFGLEERPDVIFFLTDGEIPDMTASFVAGLNGQGKRAVINTIAFGDPSSQELLKKIATDSGGAYRFVPSD